MLECQKIFEKTYLKPADDVAFCPYRICPLGAHSDHQLGLVSGFAIDKGINIAYAPKQNGVIELVSLQFAKRAQFHVDSVFCEKQNDWADYLRGATIALSKRYPLKKGVCGVIEGSLPIGGLSSSAAVTIAFLLALSKANNITLAPSEMISIALEAETDYVGVSVGKLDQSCEVYCKKDHLLFLDTKDDSYELIPQSKRMKPFDIVIFFSGLERSLAGSKFNMRVDECRSAAYMLKAFAGLEYGKFSETNLRDVDEKVFNEYKHLLPDNFRKRAEHWYSEFNRVKKGAEAFRKGDIEEFGRLCFESGYSSIYSYETGSDELKALYHIMRETKGIYGGRFSGAGFKGCCMALVNPEYTDFVIDTVKTKYLEKFPHLAEKFSVHICKTSDGVCL